MCLKLFPSIIFAVFRYFFESPVYGPIPMTPFCHHFSQLTILSPFFYHFVTVYDGTTENIIDDKLNQAIGEYYNGTKNVIAVTESVNFCLNSVEASFQMIIDACNFSVPALHQLVKNLIFC